MEQTTEQAPRTKWLRNKLQPIIPSEIKAPEEIPEPIPERVMVEIETPPKPKPEPIVEPKQPPEPAGFTETSYEAAPRPKPIPTREPPQNPSQRSEDPIARYMEMLQRRKRLRDERVERIVPEERPRQRIQEHRAKRKKPNPISQRNASILDLLPSAETFGHVLGNTLKTVAPFIGLAVVRGLLPQLGPPPQAFIGSPKYRNSPTDSEMPNDYPQEQATPSGGWIIE
jgi:hypothetical protein